MISKWILKPMILILIRALWSTSSWMDITCLKENKLQGCVKSGKAVWNVLTFITFYTTHTTSAWEQMAEIPYNCRK
jgi:hypothetical protein